MAASGFRYYYYTPSKAGAIVVMLFWIVAFAIHLWQLVRTKTKFWIPFLIGVFSKHYPVIIGIRAHH